LFALWSIARVYLRPHLGRLTFLGGLVMLGSLLALLGPQILQRFVDQASVASAGTVLAVLAVTYCVCASLQQVAAVAEEYAATDLAVRATNRLRQDLFDHSLTLGRAFHQRVPPGALIQRVDRDPAMLGNLLSRMAVALAGNALIVVGVLVLLWRLDWRIGVVMVGAALVAAALRMRLAPVVTRAWVGARQAVADLFGDVEELLGGLEDIAGLGAADYAEGRLERSARGQVRPYLHAALVGGAAGAAETIFALGTTIALGVAAVLYQRGVVTLGQVFLVAAYGGLSLAPLQALGRQLEDLQPATAAAARCRELLRLGPDVRPPARPKPLPEGPLAVDVRELSFAYEDGEEALSGVSFQVPAGGVLGIVGRTGSGKSTLARLLVRLHEIPAGTVQLGGVDLTRIATDQLRRRVAYVPQEVHLLDATLVDNLTLYQPGAPAQVRAALVEAGLGAWLDTQAQGLETQLSSDRALSAGEAQLLALARVFLRQAGLIVLDEPSARLDLVTQRRLQRALDRLFAGSTAIVVAHRPETLERATHILVLEDGTAVEFGSRSELAQDPDSRFARLLRAGPAEVLV
jgi:ABC-type multidrug transport system fused ATPase/permease subunit